MILLPSVPVITALPDTPLVEWIDTFAVFWGGFLVFYIPGSWLLGLIDRRIRERRE